MDLDQFTAFGVLLQRGKIHLQVWPRKLLFHDISNLINKLNFDIAISLQSRPREKKCIETPAPGQYSIDKAGNQISDKAPR